MWNKKYPLLVGILVGFSVLCLVAYIYFFNSQDMKKINDTASIQQTSATILALTSLGSVLSVRISKDLNTANAQEKSLVPVFAGIIVIIVLHAYTIFAACCNTITIFDYGLILGGTVASFFTMIIGYATMIDAQLNETRRIAKHKRMDGELFP